MNEMLPTTNSATRAHALRDQFSCQHHVVQYRSIVRERCWVPVSIGRINGDRTFGATFQDEALLDLIGNHIPPDLFKNKGSDAASATDSNEEAEYDYNDGSKYDKSDYLAEDDDWVCATRRPRLTFPHLSERARSVESLKRCWCHRFLPRLRIDNKVVRLVALSPVTGVIRRLLQAQEEMRSLSAVLARG
jgi:hypothetical protein